jgi:hypothetical protein
MIGSPVRDGIMAERSPPIVCGRGNRGRSAAHPQRIRGQGAGMTPRAPLHPNRPSSHSPDHGRAASAAMTRGSRL